MPLCKMKCQWPLAQNFIFFPQPWPRHARDMNKQMPQITICHQTLPSKAQTEKIGTRFGARVRN